MILLLITQRGKQMSDTPTKKEQRLIDRINKRWPCDYMDLAFYIDGAVTVTSEQPPDNGETICSYYGEGFGVPYPSIHAELETMAEKAGMYWEWRHAGGIGAWPV